MNVQINIVIIALIAFVLLLIAMIILIQVNGKQQLERQKEIIMRLRTHAEEFMPPVLKALDDWKMEVHTAIKLAAKDRPIKRGEKRDQYDYQLFNSILYCNNSNYFFRKIDERLNNFSSKIRRYYALSDRELLFICLSLLSLSDEQIAIIMNYSSASIPTTRKRIGKKLGINNNNEWNSTLLDLVQQN